MSTERRPPRGAAWARRALLLAAVVAAIGAQAQSSGSLPPFGSGPGYHDPRSPFKPLEDREGVVKWSLLGSVTVKASNNRMLPAFPPAVQALHGQTLKVQGFMLPLEPGLQQKHFLLSSVPTTCSFCVPAGPEGMVEVRSRVPVKYTLEPVVMQGRLAVLGDDPYGLFYRIGDAEPAP